MTKIYNEIIIDMNPESSSYEETLYEDSYEYSGHVMLVQGKAQMDAYNTIKATLDEESAWVDVGGEVYWRDTTGDGVFDTKMILQVKRGKGDKIEHQIISIGADGEVVANRYDKDGTWGDPQDVLKQAAISVDSHSSSSGAGRDGSVKEVEAFKAKIEDDPTGWGQDSLDISDFYGADGEPLDIDTITEKILEARYLPSQYDEMRDKVRNSVYQFTDKIEEVDPEKIAQLQQQKAFKMEGADIALAGAEATYAKDIYSLQQAETPAVIPSTGVTARGGIEKKADVKKRFEVAGEGLERAEDVYALAEDKADFAYETGIYDLDEAAADDFYTSVGSLIDNLPEATGN
jgi:hypothetical protein